MQIMHLILPPYTFAARSTTPEAMATKRSVSTLSEADLKGKVVFIRSDLNVPQVGLRLAEGLWIA